MLIIILVFIIFILVSIVVGVLILVVILVVVSVVVRISGTACVEFDLEFYLLLAVLNLDFDLDARVGQVLTGEACKELVNLGERLRAYRAYLIDLSLWLPA